MAARGRAGRVSRLRGRPKATKTTYTRKMYALLSLFSCLRVQRPRKPDKFGSGALCNGAIFVRESNQSNAPTRARARKSLAKVTKATPNTYIRMGRRGRLIQAR